MLLISVYLSVLSLHIIEGDTVCLKEKVKHSEVNSVPVLELIVKAILPCATQKQCTFSLNTVLLYSVTIS